MSAFRAETGGTSSRPGLVAIVLAVIASIAWFGFGFLSMERAIDDLARVSVPGEAVVELDAGEQSVYYESAEGSDAAVPGIQVRLVAADGTAIPVGPHGGKVSYDIGGRGGRSVAGFELEEAGSYRLTATAFGGVPPEATLAVGPGVGGRIVRTVVGGLVLAFAGMTIGIVLLVRARRRRMARAGAEPGAPAPTAPPPPTPG